MLLFFDIDGTLFDDRRNLPASVRPALEQAGRNGHSLFINTWTAGSWAAEPGSSCMEKHCRAWNTVRRIP